MGARDSGPKPCMNVAKLADVIAEIFQAKDQFRGSCLLAVGWGTSTLLDLFLTK